ncbi:MAG: S41 family peptidase, partial [Bacteroidota bacterium]
KYFYPSDEAQEIDWDLFAIYGAKESGKAKTKQDLKMVLQRLFKPIAPTLKISFSLDSTFHYQLPDSIKNHEIDTITWQHYGAGEMSTKGYYKSTRTNRDEVINHKNERSFTILDLGETKTNYDSIKIEIKTKHDGTSWNTVSDLTAGFLRKNSQRSFSEKKSIFNKDWETVEIKELVNFDLKSILLYISLYNKGRLIIDNIKLYGKKQNNWLTLNKIDFSDSLKVNFVRKNTNILYKENIINNVGSNGSHAFVVSSQEIAKKTNLLYKEKLKIEDLITKSIGSGLFCSFPPVLLGDSTGTFPKSNSTLLQALKKDINKLNLTPAVDNTQDLSIGNVIIAWNIFQHFYPYFDIVKINWDQVLKEHISLAIDGQESTQDILRRLIHHLDDGHGIVTKKESREKIFYPFNIVSIKNEFVVIDTYSEALSKYKGAKLRSLNNERIEKYYERKKKYFSASNEYSLQNKVIFDVMSNSRNSNAFGFELLNGEYDSITISPSMGPRAFYSRFLNRTAFEPIDFLTKEIAYINIANFDIDDFKAKYDTLATTKSIILDNRLTTYDYAQELIPYFIHRNDSAKWLLVPKVLRPDNTKNLSYDSVGWFYKPNIDRYSGQIYYLVSNISRSYAESMAAYFEQIPNATIVGQPTAGVNGDINSISIPGNYTIIWTGTKVLKHDGSQLHGIGIIPDVYVERTPEGIAAGRDEVLEKAIELAKASAEK